MMPVWTCLENDRAPIAVNSQTKEVLRNSITEFFNSHHFCILCVRLYREYFNIVRNSWEEYVCMFFKNCFSCGTLYLVRAVLS